METIFPVVTLIIGYFGTLLTEWFRDHRGGYREANRFRVQFQRETLLDLQEALQRMARTSGKSFFEDEMAYRDTGQWRRNILSDEANNGAFEARVQVVRLMVRVSDDSLRQLIEEFQDLDARASLASGAAEALRLHEQEVDMFAEVNKRIGQVLRALE